MKPINYNVFQMNTRNVQKKVAEEKTNEVKGEEKGESPKPVTVNPGPVTANALDVVAKQNMGLQGVVVKPQGLDGAIGPNGGGNGILHLDGYDGLVSEWNANHASMTNQEKLSLLSEIITKVGNDEHAKIYWHTLRGEVKAQLIEEKLHNVDPNTVYTPEYQGYGNYEGNCAQDLADMWHDTDYITQILPNIPGNPNSGFTSEEINQAYKTFIAECRVYIAMDQNQLNSPNVPEEVKQRLSEHIQFLQGQIEYCQRQMNIQSVQTQDVE